ncbi:MAG: RNA polymerase sigma factor [Planctomycetes bacterium]|nr:RNA polymerase sigma factor [Planctomycetota bacterium]
MEGSRSSTLFATPRRSARESSVGRDVPIRPSATQTVCTFFLWPVEFGSHSTTTPDVKILTAPASDTRDLDLVHQTLDGSREAYGLLVVRYSRSVRATCLARVGWVDDLDDMVQETFLRAFRGLSRLQDPARFAAYVHRIAQNISVDRLRRTGKEPVALDELELEPERQPSAATDIREERLARMRKLVGRLPEALREAVLLFYFEQKSHAEIAAMLEVTEAAVNQRLHRARLHLKQAFGEGEVT